MTSRVGVAPSLKREAVSNQEPLFDAGSIRDIDSPKRAKKHKRGRRLLFFGRRKAAFKKRRPAWQRWVIRSVLIVTLLALASGGFLAVQAASKVHKVFRGGGSAKAIVANVAPALLKGEGDGRVNILLLGKGGAGHDGADLTDTMLLVSIDPVNHKSALVSIPRDLWVQSPDTGAAMKINAVYALAKEHALYKNPKDPAAAEATGIADAEKIVHAVLGVNINYFGMIDFQAFQQAVDTLGGVTFNVPEEVDDATMAWQNGGSSVLARAGTQTFNGKQALMYVRSRHGSARGDFDRTERQRLFITALTQKMLTAGTYTNPLKVSGLISAFGDHMSTDFSVTDAVRLTNIAKDIPDAAITSIGLADPPNNYVKTGAAGGQSVVIPMAGINNYAPIQQYIRTQLPDGYIIKEAAKVAIESGASSGMPAQQVASELKNYGYSIAATNTSLANVPTKTVLVDMSHGTKPYTKNYLEQRFGTKATSTLPAGVQTNGSDFIILTGQT